MRNFAEKANLTSLVASMIGAKRAAYLLEDSTRPP
jgi:hypothetical protein